MQGLVVAGLLALCVAQPALADYTDDIGYSRLVQQAGSAVPDEAGVTVIQVEAATGQDSNSLKHKSGLSRKTSTTNGKG